MRTAAGILFLVLVIWLGLEIFTNGTQGAFGGAIAGLFGESAERESAAPPIDRIRNAVEDAHRVHEARTQRLAGDAGEADEE